MNTKKKQPRYSVEFRDLAVRLVEEQQKAGLSQWAAMQSISQKLGCTPETLRRWVRQIERDQGKRPGLTTAEAEEPKRLRRENKELKRANDGQVRISHLMSAPESVCRTEAEPFTADRGLHQG